MNMDAANWLPAARELRDDQSLFFDYLFCLTCIDWKTHLTMVYHLSSTKYRHNLVVRSKLDRNNPGIESVSPIFGERLIFMKEKYMKCLV
jgi:NADH-quinone oxidoreductase subunit C